MINLELYKVFKVVAEHENITNASKTLNISQPAVTKHIQNLEDYLGIRLFERTNKGLILTDNGKRIYEEINEPLAILDRIYIKYSSKREINLGVHATMMSKLFGKQLSKYYENNEKAKINITNNDAEEMLLKLEKQELDIVISKKINNLSNEKIEFIKVGDLHDILVVNSNSHLFEKIITIEELKEEILYMPRKTSLTTINFFKSTNTKEEDFKDVKNITYNTMLEIIKNTDSVGLVTKEYINKELENNDIVLLKTNFKINPIEYGIYINKDNRFKELEACIKILKENVLA